MAIYSNLHDYRFNDTDIDDVRGADVYGADDQKLGKIDDVIFDDSTGELRYVVIDSGGWLSSKRFVIPSRQLMIRDEQDKDFHVSITKEQVEKFPPYNEKHVESEGDWNDYEERYEASWADGPILHREGSTHAITPETVAGSGSGNPDVHVQSPRRIAHDMPRFGALSSSDSVDTPTLAGEIDEQPTVSGARKTIGRQVDETISSEQESESTGEPKEDNIGTGSLNSKRENSRLRQFEERLRRDREEIARHRGKRAA